MWNDLSTLQHGLSQLRDPESTPSWLVSTEEPRNAAGESPDSECECGSKQHSP